MDAKGKDRNVMDSKVGEGTTRSGETSSGELIERLISVLEGHAKNHRRLLSIMERKTAALVAGRIDDLEDIGRLERDALERIAESEAERIVATEAVGAALGFAPFRLRLLDLITVSGEAHRDSLLDLRDELRDLYRDMDRVNLRNCSLAVEALEAARMHRALGGSHPETTRIRRPQGPGEAHSPPQAPVLDRHDRAPGGLFPGPR